MELSEFSKKVLSFNIPLFQEIAVENKSDVLVKLNLIQLLKGLTSKGKKISPKYKGAKYASKKNGMNSRPGMGTPDLKLSGDFHAGFIAIVNKDKYFLSSEDSQVQYLPEKYADIFGLTSKNEFKAQKEVTNEFIRLFEKHVT